MNLVTGHSLVCVLCNSFPFCFSFLGLYLLFFRGLNIRCRFPFCIQSYFSSLLKHLCVHLNTFVCFINHVTLHSTPPATRINSIYIHMLKSSHLSIHTNEALLQGLLSMRQLMSQCSVVQRTRYPLLPPSPHNHRLHSAM